MTKEKTIIKNITMTQREADNIHSALKRYYGKEDIRLCGAQIKRFVEDMIRLRLDNGTVCEVEDD
jgi:hypothetical protein